MPILEFFLKFLPKSPKTPPFLLLRRNKWLQRIPHEKLRHPALFKLVFVANTTVMGPKNVLFSFPKWLKNTKIVLKIDSFEVKRTINSAGRNLFSRRIRLFYLF